MGWEIKNSERQTRLKPFSAQLLLFHFDLQHMDIIYCIMYLLVKFGDLCWFFVLEMTVTLRLLMGKEGTCINLIIKWFPVT